MSICADVLGTGYQKKNSVAKTRKSLEPFRNTQVFYYQIFQNKTMLKLKMPNTVIRKKKIKQLQRMNGDSDAMPFQLIYSGDQVAVGATPSSKFFVMTYNTTQSLDRPRIKRKLLLDTS